MDWIKITETQNLCTLCKHYDYCTKIAEPNYDCWEKDITPTQKRLKQNEIKKTLEKFKFFK